MKKLKKFWPLLLLCLFPLSFIPFKGKKTKVCQDVPAVTYNLSGGRLGDNLLSYLHAKWLAEKNGYQFYFTPFPGSDKFKCSEVEAALPKAKRYKEVAYRLPLKDVQSKKPLLYRIPYFPEALEDRLRTPYACFEIEWDDPSFKKLAKDMISPISRVDMVELKKDHFNLALHIRRGSGTDTPFEIVSRPLKFPPLSFYIQGVKAVKRLVGHQPLFVYVFTDAKEPALLKNRLKKALPGVEIECRTNQVDVLSDFFSMMEFDGIVRASSNLSLVAAKLGDMKVEIAPKHFTVKPGETNPVIDQLVLSFHQEEAFRGSRAPSEPSVAPLKDPVQVMKAKASAPKVEKRANNISDHLVEKPCAFKLQAKPPLNPHKI